MAQQTINVGTIANDGTGDTIRAAMVKVNSNFTEVYGNLATLQSDIADIGLSGLTSGEFVYANNGSLGSISGLAIDQYGTIRYDRTGNSDSLPAMVIYDTLNTVLTLVEYSESNENAPALALIKNRGSKSSPQPAAAGDLLGVVSALGVDSLSSGRILWKASSTSTSSITNSSFEIQTKVNGTLATRFSIDETGGTVVSSLKFADNSVQTGAAISIADLKTLVAASTDFADFQSRIAAL